MQPIETINFVCPYCNESIELMLDCSLSERDLVEDCTFCCQPILIHLQIDSDGVLSVTTQRENE